MNFDKWFNEQDVVIKAILLLLPVCGWVVELLIRLSVFMRTKSAKHLIVLLVFVFIGWGWILSVADFIYCMVNGKLILTE